ncbi:hypothetical protein OH492_00870 [Vibrio chagasii]|nr:hypothetical protein [Vibrio chagasii]
MEAYYATHDGEDGKLLLCRPLPHFYFLVTILPVTIYQAQVSLAVAMADKLDIIVGILYWPSPKRF